MCGARGRPVAHASRDSMCAPRYNTNNHVLGRSTFPTPTFDRPFLTVKVTQIPTSDRTHARTGPDTLSKWYFWKHRNATHTRRRTRTQKCTLVLADASAHSHTARSSMSMPAAVNSGGSLLPRGTRREVEEATACACTAWCAGAGCRTPRRLARRAPIARPTTQQMGPSMVGPKERSHPTPKAQPG